MGPRGIPIVSIIFGWVIHFWQATLWELVGQHTLGAARATQPLSSCGREIWGSTNSTTSQIFGCLQPHVLTTGMISANGDLQLGPPTATNPVQSKNQWGWTRSSGQRFFAGSFAPVPQFWVPVTKKPGSVLLCLKLGQPQFQGFLGVLSYTSISGQTLWHH